MQVINDRSRERALGFPAAGLEYKKHGGALTLHLQPRGCSRLGS
jgi:hypothetical protein